MNDQFAKAAEQVAAFQKIWMDSFTQFVQGVTPTSASPDLLRQMRANLFQSLARSWDEFLRSPQFLEGMRQWVDSTTNFRKLSNDWMARVRNEFQAPSREDIDTIMLNVRHMEKRLLDRIEELSKRINARNGQSNPNRPARPLGKSPRASSAKNSRRNPRAKRKDSL